MSVKTLLRGIGYWLLLDLAFRIISGMIELPLQEKEMSLMSASIMVAGGLLALVYFVRYTKKVPSAEMIERPWTRTLWLPIVLYLLHILVQNVFPSLSPNQEQVSVLMQDRLPFAFIAIVIVGPIGEELLYRKLLASYFFPNMSTKTAICLYLLTTGLLFALVHKTANLYQFSLYGFSGVIYGLLYLYKRDIRHSMALHIVNNFLGFLTIVI